VISPGVLVEPNALVENSVVMHGAVIGADAVVRNAIVDKNVKVHPGARLGVDAEADRARFTISAHGVVVVGKGEQVHRS
jgi:glucose-1-phosphate adenylyltransferase